jgi:hypothetical protein
MSWAAFQAVTGLNRIALRCEGTAENPAAFAGNTTVAESVRTA